MCWTLRTTSGGTPIGITGLAVIGACAAASASLRAGATGHRPRGRHEDARRLRCCRGAPDRRSSLKASAPPSSRPGESWLSAAWVYDHAPRKRNAFVRPVVPASTLDRDGRRRLAS